MQLNLARFFAITVLFFSLCENISAQTLPVDSAKKLHEVTVKGYYNQEPLIRSTAAVSMLDSGTLKNENTTSLVGALNTIAGVRMEERSPGSYRLSLRGSLLRSPFGIRNVKIYIDDFPLTDAGGNTYLNLLDLNSIGSMEIYKGPDGSIFGANTGGVVLINPKSNQNNATEIGLSGGSYGLFSQHANVQRTFKNYQFSISEAYQRSDGYRQNSAMDRKFIQTTQRWQYSPKANLHALIFYSDLTYQTPGGLTASQLAENPKFARQATKTLPGAIEQQAAIYNKTIFAGLSNSYQFNKNFKHVLAVFGSYTDFRNPFITNYEKRFENTLGLRTFLDYTKLFQNNRVNAQLGVESSQTGSEIRNFDNNKGAPAAIQAFDNLKASQTFAFVKLKVDVNKKLLMELASSLNFYRYNYESLAPVAIAKQENKFKHQWMPKAAVSYLFTNKLAIRATAGRGYSTPTIAEVRSSNNEINANLQAELGWNYETGIRYQTDKFYLNANLFRFNLADAIVRRLDANGNEFFINAGGTSQQGLEFEGSFVLLKKADGFLNLLKLASSYTLNHFKFTDFSDGTNNYGGNNLTGVPKNVWVNSVDLGFKKGFYLFVQNNFTDKIPLNDGNSAYAKSYNLLDAKAGMRGKQVFGGRLDFYIGINNILNRKYSLGNDLNAFGGRYYNPSATVNIYTGINLAF
ncbi:iron complex outermembrane receptor protein [Pedobacter sp. UYP30]|uniref:TonB-dependent receptor n=1 Tax=Pedobacter sp. UYP30 TaxID=1756400 RepID=UPI0033926D1C